MMFRNCTRKLTHLRLYGLRLALLVRAGGLRNGNGYRGVRKQRHKSFGAYGGVPTRYIGTFSTAEEAALAVARKKQDM